MTDKQYFLISTNKNCTYMLSSTDPKTLVIFENQQKEVDSTGNIMLYYSSIQIRKM